MLKLNAIKDEETRLEENLNTSHVKVKLGYLAVDTSLNTFKYISC